MEHPFFALSTKRDTRIREYVSPNKKVKVTIIPSSLGHPTVMDQDLLIYAATLIRQSMEDGRMGEQNEPIKIPTYNFLMATGRGDGGKNYKQIHDMVKRLRGATIDTNIETGGVREIETFGLIASSKIRIADKDNKVLCFELKLSDWLYRGIWNAKEEMLSMNKRYFEIRAALERRLYQIARKHCGNQTDWSIKLETLHHKVGSEAPLKKFRLNIRESVKKQNLPDYLIMFDDKRDMVTFARRGSEAVAKVLLGQMGLS
jgi:plasmid replication initiation protein